MRKLIFFTLLLIPYISKAAPRPSQWRFDFQLGQAFSNYKEERNSVILPDRDINQTSYTAEAHAIYWMIPKYLDLNFGIREIGLSPSSPKDSTEQFRISSNTANMGINFPFFSDFVWIKLVGEIFYANMVTEDSFGFRNLTGAALYPTVEFFPYGTDLYTSISPFIRAPIVSSSSSWQEWTYGIKMRFPIQRGRPRFPLYAYQKALVLRLMYSHLKVNIEKEGYLPVKMEHAYTALTLGFEF